MATHACLLVNEIVSEIIYHLLADGHERSIVNLGMTCKALFDPAMDILWEDIDTWEPLLMCFPHDVWLIDGDEYVVENEIPLNTDAKICDDSDEDGREVKGSTSVSPQILVLKTATMPDVSFLQSEEPRGVTFRRYLNPNDWARFDLYAPRVKTLGNHHRRSNFHVALGGRNLPTIEFSLSMGGFHDLIMESRHSVPLLPNLRELVINGRNLEILPHIGSLLGPHVSRVHVKYLWDGRVDHCIVPEHLDSLFSHIARSSPSLRCLQIGSPGRCLGIPESLDLGDSVSRLVVQMDNLESFSCPWSLSEDALCHLASLPALRSLEVYHAAPLDFLCVVPDSHVSFLALTNLTLTTQNWSLGIPWLEVIRSPLQSLQILVQDTPESSEPLENLSEFIRSLHATRHRGSLVAISLRDQSLSSYYTTHDRLMLSSSLTPLFEFSNLHAIDINCHSDFHDLDDAWINNAAQAWPNLQSLTIASNVWKISTRPNITLRGLLPLIIHCRSLSTLTISIDACDTDWISSESFPPNTELLEITSPMAVIRDSYGAFLCLSKMFARLEDFNVFFSLQTRSRGSWGDVSELLRAHRASERDSLLS